jgi:ATP-binding cassette subfamily F protein 3
MRSGKIVVRARELHKSFGDNVVYDGLDLELLRGEKVALVGPNGAGKTTALRMIAGVLEPDAGELEIGHNVDVAYFAQHAVDQLEIERTVLEEMRASASPDAQPRVRSMLGAFGFSGDAVDKKISVLSGGEKSRLALCKMLLEPANLLLLDEPTNHLDIDSRRTLESALKDFEGTFCVVSHDRYFLNEVVTKIVHIEQGRATVYNGDYDYYRWKQREEREEQRGADEERGSDGELQRGSDGELTRKQRRQLAAELRRERSREAGAIERALTEIEEEIAELEERAAELESTLGDPSTYEDDSLDVGELQQDYHAVQEALDRQMEQWEERQLELDEIDARYREREEELGLS